MTFWNKFWIDWNFCTYSFMKRNIKLGRQRLLTMTKIIWGSKIYGVGSALEEKYFGMQKWDILECRIWGRGASPDSTLTLFVTELLCHYAMCKESSYPKNEYNLFYQELDAAYYFIQQFCRKYQYFLRKQWKTVLGHNWLFRKRRRLVPKLTWLFLLQMRYRIIHCFSSFFKKKKAVFSEKMAKNCFWGPSLFWRDGGVWRRKWI